LNDQEMIVGDIIYNLKNEPGALLPILHRVQEQLGFISKEAQTQIADGLNLSSAEIHGVVSFYHDFKTAPIGQHTIQICRAEACQSVGGQQLETYIKNLLGTDYHKTTEDGAIQLEPVYCLGNCACGPSLRIGDRIYGRVTPAKADALIAECAPTQKGER